MNENPVLLQQRIEVLRTSVAVRRKNLLAVGELAGPAAQRRLFG